MKFVSTFILSLCLSSCIAVAHAQTIDNAGGEPPKKETLQKQFKKHVEDKPRDEFLTLTVENDSLASGADRNYTNGIRISWYDTGDHPPAIASFLDTIIPVFPVNDTTSVYYSVGQNLYTPRELSLTTPDPKDRPYAGFLYGSVGMSNVTNNHQDNVELTVGIVGPYSLGKETQEFVHTLLNAAYPKGWGHQLNTEVGLMASWEHLWPEAYTAEMGDLHFRASPYIGATLGNIYTYANSGLMFQLVPKQYKWQTPPLRVRPAMPGNGYFSVPEGEFSWSLFAGFEGRAVGRNIFLDGNTFEDSPSVGKKPIVGDANIGVAFTYGHAQINYTLNWRAPEFYGQDSADLFGAVSIGYRF
ncbi:MAG: lipid A deacylase LpxR family protein [Alphaproteobacteria bacterium]|nr:lipid A deacylase LpxR family protein [Alphaproteobacteria bacterium]